MTKPTTAPSPLSTGRAFVLHLGAAADPRRGHLEGRIEHVATGRIPRFAALDELLTFLGDALRPDARSDSTAAHRARP